MFRRDFLKTATLTSAGLMIPTSFSRLANADDEMKPAFRFVHLTDIHVQPEREGGAGMTKCLEAVEALDPKPDFILTGGDLIYDAGKDYERGNQLFKLYKQIVADHTGIPVHPCVGNHDVYGWSRREELDTMNPLFGKGLIRDHLELEKTYYAFDHNGWRFYVLDSIQPTVEKRYKYTAGLDEEQMAWLQSDLAAKPKETPAVVVTHIPVLTVTSMRKQPELLGEDFYISGGPGMFSNSLEMGRLFHNHNVKLALSGHLHEIDRIERGNVTYICDGAVCGGWWYGPNIDSGFEVQEGFGVVDIHTDGTFEHHYVDYGWEAKVQTKG
ncbi:3',5'-cyclic adenosine monophosphate phosphodiesterase CpdA [Polystyrenella longa]|uniref:3',5'-cyclic adenosine monophosphate phosphodiesterase CpdA n=1 Tax=Polystyrenella longa TaxID=2528007 RepID=A0A518CGT7_9PLAN|nr:metallophosphoesterase [Polystyrenella longa]QDU78437.1 3',5'-cyclic adenosine monophosphate phosphodiesterase CpdA [Polystyrenella longa]